MTLIFLYGFANPFLNERKKKSRVEVKGGEGEINQLFQTKLFSHFPFFKSWSICKTLRHSFAHNQWAKRVPGILKHTFFEKPTKQSQLYPYHFLTNLVIFHTAFRFSLVGSIMLYSTDSILRKIYSICTDDKWDTMNNFPELVLFYARFHRGSSSRKHPLD